MEYFLNWFTIDKPPIWVINQTKGQVNTKPWSYIDHGRFESKLTKNKEKY